VSSADAAGDAAAPAIRPLRMSQLKQFIRDGYLVLQVVDGVPEGFHGRVFAKAHSSHGP
jgi:hypothetical protein